MIALAQALHGFQKDAPPITFDATNPHFKNKYASLAGVLAVIRPALNKQGLIYVQLPTNLDGQPALETTVIHAESGEKITATAPLILSKQDAQGYGSALTYARRYALLSILGLVGDEDDDANSATSSGAGGPEVTKGSATPSAAHSPVPDPHGLQQSRADAVQGDATDKQKAMICRLAKKLNHGCDDVDTLSKSQASGRIEELLALEAGEADAVATGGGAVTAGAGMDAIPFQASEV